MASPYAFGSRVSFPPFPPTVSQRPVEIMHMNNKVWAVCPLCNPGNRYFLGVESKLWTTYWWWSATQVGSWHPIPIHIPLIEGLVGYGKLLRGPGEGLQVQKSLKGGPRGISANCRLHFGTELPSINWSWPRMALLVCF